MSPRRPVLWPVAAALSMWITAAQLDGPTQGALVLTTALLFGKAMYDAGREDARDDRQ